MEKERTPANGGQARETKVWQCNDGYDRKCVHGTYLKMVAIIRLEDYNELDKKELEEEVTHLAKSLLDSMVLTLPDTDQIPLVFREGA